MSFYLDAPGEEAITPQSPPASEPVSPETETVDQPIAEPEQKTDESPSAEVDEVKLNLLKSRQKEYKVAALAWKRAGNHEEAMNNIKITKQFDTVINAVIRGETVDLADMPPSPSLPGVSAVSEPPSDDGKQENESQQATQPDPAGNTTLEMLNTQ